MGVEADPAETSPVLIVPYMWIGDFVRGHSVVRVLKERWPNRPVDLLTTTLCRPLVDYMPGVRNGIEWNLPRGQIAMDQQKALAHRLKQQNYGTALIMPRTWKAALAPMLAGIPQRTGFVGEMRFGLLNDWRWGEKKLARMIDKKCALALPPEAKLIEDWPPPQLVVPPEEIAAWRKAKGLGDNAAIALAPGAVGPAKRWTYYAEAAKTLADKGFDVWVIGGPGEKQAASDIVAIAGPRARDMTGTDLRDGILALAAATIAISNDSGLMHVAAAAGTPVVGIFGPTSPYHWAPLNGLAATLVQTKTTLECQPCHKPVCRMNHHLCMRDIPVSEVVARALDVIDNDRVNVANFAH
ncbi:MAG: lipopolysaccharide heptosyltransferase II [Bradyrhizobiaceae bacterium]|nr:MAG: lipopolysaccharide heptosyltransferase II [Bradyrhizobiaceae bacterium]